MTTTDSDALTESLWEAIAEVRDRHPRVVTDAPTDDVVAAVLPLIAAEIRKGQAAALRHSAEKLLWFGAQGNTLDHLRAWDVVRTCMKAIKADADRIEQED